ncbi:uncharacterized protein LOC113274549 [Papaver somniferum]|uniref:uncharacterized protein LOC113274549 n=1 Tax=Papaver somniferum TaxID=3469 RepID=UPI000E70203C|nr:uncharacterized protein LOC113274549 [Papaver somniferum]
MMSMQEFNVIMRRCTMRYLEPFMYVIVVRKEGENALNGMLKNVIGTLDFRFKYMLQGETYPEPAVNLFSTFKRRGPQKHGIISNIIVAKSARQQGIKQVYLHVCRDNKPALALYKKMGFGRRLHIWKNKTYTCAT